MYSKSALRSALLAVSISVAFTANASIISGAGDTNAGGGITTIDYRFSNLAGINSATYSFIVVYRPGNGEFTGSFTDGLNFLNVAQPAGNVSIANNTYSFSGTWNLVSTNLAVAPTGTYSAIFDLNSQRYQFNVATAPPVPEPASIAALGVGVVALIRRRRR